MSARLFTFVAGDEGPWEVIDIRSYLGEGLPTARRLKVVMGAVEQPPAGSAWMLRGITSNERYVTRSEKDELVRRQPVLGRPESDRAVLIPLRKNSAWWSLTQDERRHIFEERSRHTATGLAYLPAVARRLHHCRDLGEREPFDFLTWFEFAGDSEADFDRLLEQLRRTPEWEFVEREVEVRVQRRR